MREKSNFIRALAPFSAFIVLKAGKQLLSVLTRLVQCAQQAKTTHSHQTAKDHQAQAFSIKHVSSNTKSLKTSWSVTRGVSQYPQNIYSMYIIQSK